MIENLIEERLRKLERAKDAHLDPYPAKSKRTHTLAEARKNFGALLKAKKRVSLVGRITGLRDQGGVLFLDLKDESGTFQIVLNKKTFAEFSLIKSVLDIGDFFEAEGLVFKTKRGEESLEVKRAKLLAKSMRPIPNERFGIEDDETRLRKRYLEILSDPEVQSIFRRKAVFWSSFREILLAEGFLEVENPVLEPTPGGAEAEPFLTHMNALDEDFYLRISLELPLKKLLVGGYEKVFEIGRIFRNEGIDREHLQDYTQLEFYWAYHDYNDLIKFLERMYKTVIKKTCGTLNVPCQGKKVNWGKKWKVVDYVAAFKKETGLDPLSAVQEELVKKAKALNLKPEAGLGRGRLIDLIYKKTVRPKLVEPCFLIDPPVEIEPLAKRSLKDPRRVERLQIVACGTELGKGFSELNDPMDQRARFEEQMRLREKGDKEAQMLDEDYLEAMEYGMPPCAGFGISERLFAVLMDKPVRETVIFPLMRHK